MHEMVKPNGVKLNVNDNSLEYALSLGWKHAKPEQSKGPKSGNRTKSNK